MCVVHLNMVRKNKTQKSSLDSTLNIKCNIVNIVILHFGPKYHILRGIRQEKVNHRLKNILETRHQKPLITVEEWTHFKSKGSEGPQDFIMKQPIRSRLPPPILETRLRIFKYFSRIHCEDDVDWGV